MSLLALFPGLPGSASTRNVKPIWILLKQETVSGSGISWAIRKSAPCSTHISTPAPHRSVFTGRMPFLPPNQQCQSTEGMATWSNDNSNDSGDDVTYLRHVAAAAVDWKRPRISRVSCRLHLTTATARQWRSNVGTETGSHHRSGSARHQLYNHTGVQVTSKKHTYLWPRPIWAVIYSHKIQAITKSTPVLFKVFLKLKS